MLKTYFIIDPVTEIGKNITTRMAEASFPLSTTMSRLVFFCAGL